MSDFYELNPESRNGNLYVKAKGTFDGAAAWSLIRLIQNWYKGAGRVFVDTRQVSEVKPFAASILESRITISLLPRERLFFKGRLGLDLAPLGCKVILESPNQSCGCPNSCRNRPRQTDAGPDRSTHGREPDPARKP
jgi:hypothetical protein